MIIVLTAIILYFRDRRVDLSFVGITKPISLKLNIGFPGNCKLKCSAGKGGILEAVISEWLSNVLSLVVNVI